MTGRAPRAETLDLQEQGRGLLTLFFTALRALRLYPPENVAVQQAIQELHRAVEGVVTTESGMELRVVGDFFFLNEVRLRLGLSNYSTFGIFARALQRHDVGAIEVGPGIELAEWTPFLSLLLRTGDSADPFEQFLGSMEGTNIDHISVQATKEAAELELEEKAALDTAKKVYTQSVRMAREALTDIRLGKAVNVRRLKRTVQGIVDQVLSDEPSIITMTTLKDFDEYTFIHSVNVCIFSIIIGQRLGFTKLQLYELGLGALFHDVGKVRVPPSVVGKTGPLTDDEWVMMQQHPTDGLLQLFHLQGFVDVPYRQMLMAYEHHMKVDGSGYPSTKRSPVPSLFSRIVAVADGFDAGTSVRSYQYKPWAPDEVLKEMRDNPGRGFDQLLVKVLINSTGVFPVGTLVILDNYELAIVVATNPDISKIHMPMVKVISDAMGLPLAEPKPVDLSQLHDNGRPIRTVIKTTDPQRYGIRVSDYVL